MFPIFCLFAPYNGIYSAYQDEIDDNYAQKTLQKTSIALYVILSIQKLSGMSIEWFAHERVTEVARPKSDAQSKEYLIDWLQASDKVRNWHVYDQESEPKNDTPSINDASLWLSYLLFLFLMVYLLMSILLDDLVLFGLITPCLLLVFRSNTEVHWTLWILDDYDSHGHALHDGAIRCSVAQEAILWVHFIIHHERSARTKAHSQHESNKDCSCKAYWIVKGGLSTDKNPNARDHSDIDLAGA